MAAVRRSCREVEEKIRVCFVGLRGLLVGWWWVIVRLRKIFRKIYRIFV
jgi:hypothetical protein